MKLRLKTFFSMVVLSLSFSACNIFCDIDESLEAERDAALGQGVDFVDGLEAEVYHAILDDFFRNRRVVIKLNVNDRFENFEALDEKLGLYEMIENEMPLLKSKTLSAFREALKEKGIVRDEFIGRHCIASEQTLESAFQNDGWDGFYNRFSGASGLVSFSRVGINEAKDQALVYFNRIAGVRGGVDSVVLLQNDASGKWKVVDEFRVRVY